MPPNAWLLPEDGIIDHLAVTIAAEGTRLVRLTPAERELAARRIIADGGGVGELVSHLGISFRQAGDLVRQLGYRLSRCKHSNTSVIITADNSRLGPERDGHGHASTCMCSTRLEDAA